MISAISRVRRFRSGLGSATLQAAAARACLGAVVVAAVVYGAGLFLAQADQDACSDRHPNAKAAVKACKRQTTEQQGDLAWTALTAGGAVVAVRLVGEGLYDKRRQDRGFGPKPGDVKW